MAAAIRPTRRPIEATMVIMALSVRVGSSLAIDNAAKALQFQSVAASLKGWSISLRSWGLQVRALPRSPLSHSNLLSADAEPYTTHPVYGRMSGAFRNPLEERHGRPAATRQAGPALWPVPVKLNGPSGRWRVRCAGSRNRGRAHGPLSIRRLLTAALDPKACLWDNSQR